MNENTTTSQDRDPAQRRRKLLAITAGGLVLGIGGAVTLASWTDTEVAAADFGAGTFALESSADGSTFGDHATPGEALTLSFDELAQNLSPQDTASAVYAIRLDEASSYAATVAGSVEATGDAADNLTYSIEQVDNIDGTNPGDILVTSEPVTAGTAHEDLFSLTSTSDVVFLKVTVAADEDLGQGESANVVWTLTGTSGESLV